MVFYYSTLTEIGKFIFSKTLSIVFPRIVYLKIEVHPVQMLINAMPMQY